jgi:L-threonylcarbamoyladenylate synthase
MTRVITIDPRDPDLDRIREVATLLREGRLIAFPTETVYGLGAHALDATAVARIFAAKGRPPTDPMIVHLASVEQLESVAREVPPVARQLAAAFWPGPLTLILDKRSIVPGLVTAGLQTVGVRVPSHPIAHALLEAANVPVAAPSANKFSHPSPTRAEHVLADLDGLVDIVIDGGATSIGVESTILDLTVTPLMVRRPGGVSLDAIRRIVGDVRHVAETADRARAQVAPGQLLRHYAPHAVLTLYVGEIAQVVARIGNEVRTAVASGLRAGVLAPEEDLLALAPRLAAIGASGRVVTMRCGSRRDRAEAARDLFQALRALDIEAVDVIFASAPDGDGINTAILDRLTRAAEGRVIRT